MEHHLHDISLASFFPQSNTAAIVEACKAKGAFLSLMVYRSEKTNRNIWDASKENKTE